MYYSILLRLRVTQKGLQLPLFSSFSFSLQQIWMDWRKLLVEFSIFVKLDDCGLIQTHWTNFMWQIFFPIWNFACYNVMNSFHDVNSVLYTVTNIYVKVGILFHKIFADLILSFPSLTSLTSMESNPLSTLSAKRNGWALTTGRLQKILSKDIYSIQ